MKIFKYYLNNPSVDIAMQDYSLIGLKKHITYERGGRKSKIEYVDLDGVNVVKLCEDMQVDGSIVEIKHTHRWLNEDDSVAEEKITYAEIDSTTRGSILRKRRQRTIDHLIDLASGTELEPVIESIFDIFKSEIAKYIQVGSKDFFNALASSDMKALTYPTGFNHPAEDRKLLVKEVILYEIG